MSHSKTIWNWCPQKWCLRLDVKTFGIHLKISSAFFPLCKTWLKSFFIIKCLCRCIGFKFLSMHWIIYWKQNCSTFQPLDSLWKASHLHRCRNDEFLLCAIRSFHIIIVKMCSCFWFSPILSWFFLISFIQPHLTR